MITSWCAKSRDFLVTAVFAVALLAAAPAAATAEDTASGTLQVVHSDYFPRHKATFSYYVKTKSGRRVAVRFRNKAPRDLGGARITVRGKKRGKRLVVRRSRIRHKTRAASTLNAPSTHKVAVVALNFSNDTSQPFTADQLRSVMWTSPSSVANYFKEGSWSHLTMTGKLRSDGDVFGWYTIPNTNAGCAWSTWASAARTAAANAGVSLSGYDHIVYVWPQASSCGWAGLAYMPGTSAYINGSFNLRVVGHELSHNIGGDHAASYSCSSGGVRVAISSTCSLSEYGDPFDILGSSSRHGSSFHRGQFGWLAPSNTQTVSTSGTYTLTTAEVDSSQPQALRIPKATSVSGSQEYYSLEYRQPFGTFDNFASTDPAVNGVMVRIAPDYSVIKRPLLVDTTPSTSTFTDAPLKTGQTFTDSANKISITTVSLSPLSATIRVDLNGTGGGTTPPPPPADTTAPSVPANLAGQAATGPAVSLSWGASTDNVGVSGYRVFRNGTQLTSTSATSYSDASVAAGSSYTYYVVAYDAAGNVSAASNQVTVAVPGGGPTSSYKASPNSVTLVDGTLYSGTVADLATNNTVFLRVTAGATSRVADWYGLIGSVPASLSNLKVVYVGKNTVTCNQVLRIYNYELGRWDTLDTQPVGTTSVSITKAPPSPAADYVSVVSGVGNVAVRVTCSGPTETYRSHGDLMRITYSA